MFRFAIISFLLTLSPTVIAAQSALDHCTEQTSLYTTCLTNAINYTSNILGLNYTACEECYLSHDFSDVNNPQFTCNDATNLICAIYNDCASFCNPEQSACEQESKDQSICIYEAGIAPENCKVQCEGGTGGGNTTGNGGGSTAGNGGGSNKGGGSTSAGPAPAAFTVSSSIFLIVVGFLF
jgi:uncharacterized membrane protein YgcG